MARVQKRAMVQTGLPLTLLCMGQRLLNTKWIIRKFTLSSLWRLSPWILRNIDSWVTAKRPVPLSCEYSNDKS